MSEVISAVNGISAGWSEAIWRASWQGAIAIAAVWALCRVWRRMPPQLRLWLWRLAYLKLVLGLLIWTRTVYVPVLPPSPAVVSAAEQRPSAELSIDLPGAGELAASAHREPAAPRPVVWLFALWIAGLGWRGAALIASWRRARRVRAGCAALDDPDLERYVVELCGRQGLRPPRLALGDAEGPLLLGLGRPIVLLPRTLVEGCRPEELRLVLAHEVAHLKGRDLTWSWLPLVGQWLFFFHPLVWLAQREWRLAQEIAADAMAVRMTSSTARDYGQALMRVMRALACARTRLAAVGIAESRETLGRRLLAMTYPTAMTRRSAALTGVVVTVLAVVALVPWRLVQRHEALGASMGSVGERGDVVPIAASSDDELLDQIHAALHNRYRAVRSFKGSVRLSNTSGVDDGATPRGERVYTVAFDGEHIRISSTIISGVAIDFDGVFDGENTTDLYREPGQGELVARIYPGLDGFTDGDFHLFVDPRGIGAFPVASPDRSIDDRDKTVTRAVLDGRDCVVVEATGRIPGNTDGAQIRTKAWYDVARGFVVPKWLVWYLPGGEADPVLTHEQTVEFRRQSGGLWLPSQFTRVQHYPDGAFEKRIVGTYGPEFEINVPITEAELELLVPPGTTVYDYRGGAHAQVYPAP